MTLARFGLVASILLSTAASGRAGDDFPAPYNSEPSSGHPMAPEAAARAFRVPEGFRVSVFAAEPDVQNPIAMAWDARGRLWIAENFTYAENARRFDLSLRDRVLIFEDSDGDGRFDRRKVFTDGPQQLTSVEHGHGGAWLMCPPQLLFVPDRDGNDVPDAAPEVVLDGFTVPLVNYHNLANGLKWGPDGWLYGRCGASSPGKVGAPGTTEENRIPLAGGLWRYHPTRKTFEVLAHGTTNPWGHDWNALGEAFFVNTVNGHLWHAVAGMHFVRPHTIDPNPRVYALIDQHADHWHWDNARDWTDSRSASGKHDELGGGHAHSGAMIYGGEQWPASYRDKLFTLNFHGRRINVDRLERSGAGYVGRHDPDMLFAGDTWFRGIDLSAGPDGSAFLLDWSDIGECHESNGVHRLSGRIYKLMYGNAKPSPAPNLAQLDSAALLALQDRPDEWHARMARLILSERAAKGESLTEVKAKALVTIEHVTDPISVLRAIWTLNAIGAADEALLNRLLGHEHEAVRGWAVRLLSDAWPLDDVVGRRPGPELARVPIDRLVALAGTDRSGLVRLVVASTLQRIPTSRRAELARPLLARGEDANDHDIPLLLWYGLAPLVESDPLALADLASKSALPRTRRLIARGLAESIDRAPGAVAKLVKSMSDSSSVAYQNDILGGLADGLKGRRQAPRPMGWEELASKLGEHSEPTTRDLVRELGVVFGSGRALDEVRRLALDDKAALEDRKTALRTLIDNRPADLRAICEKLLKIRFLNATAARGLALFDDPEIGRSLVASYRMFHPSERPALLDALASRVTFARVLLDAVAAGKIPAAELTPFQARQIRGLGDPDLSQKLTEVWGEARDSAPDKKALMARLRARLTPSTLAAADRSQGRVVFEKACGACHTLYGRGGQVGPDLTGSGRDNIDYLLENIIDPGAVVTADYRMSVVAMKDGRVLNGVIKSRNDKTMTLQMQNEAITLDRGDVDEIRATTASLMPEGLVEALTEVESRDLFAYLMSRAQAPLPGATP
jgi:putative membrane-bound dehydrogenase-like protein